MLFDIKWSYLLSLSMFELGSLICGVAPNSVALIIGRAIAGLGSAGLLTGSFVVVSHTVPLAKRPLMTAVVGLMYVLISLLVLLWITFVNHQTGSE
jgi:MFS family permease